MTIVEATKELMESSAQKLATEMDRGNIVIVFGDRGERYFSPRLFD